MKTSSIPASPMPAGLGQNIRTIRLGARRIASPLLLLIILMQLTTIALYYFGPIDYKHIKYEVAGWILYYLFMLLLGSFFARNYYLRNKSDISGEFIARRKKFVLHSFLFSMLFILPTFYGRVGGFHLAGSLGEQYAMAAAHSAANQSVIEYVRMFFSVYLFGFFPTYLYFHEKLSPKLKKIGLIVSILNLLLAVFTGVNKYLFDYALIGIAIFMLKYAIKRKKNYTKILFSACILGVVFSALLYFFALGQASREGSPSIKGIDPKMDSVATYNLDDGLFLMGYSALTSYLTQGYRIFDMSLDEKFVWTYGIGNSTFLSRQADKVLGTNIGDLTYPARLEYRGTDRYINWSTFYLWWVSDLGYLGVGVLTFLGGFLFRISENTIFKTSDHEALIIYAYLTIGFFYLSANNQLFQSGETAVGFFYLLIKIMLTKKISILPSGRRAEKIHT